MNHSVIQSKNSESAGYRCAPACLGSWTCLTGSPWRGPGDRWSSRFPLLWPFHLNTRVRFLNLGLCKLKEWTEGNSNRNSTEASTFCLSAQLTAISYLSLPHPLPNRGGPQMSCLLKDSCAIGTWPGLWLRASQWTWGGWGGTRLWDKVGLGKRCCHSPWTFPLRGTCVAHTGLLWCLSEGTAGPSTL